MEVTKLMNVYRKSNNGLIRGACRKISKFLGCMVGDGCVIGNNVRFVHNSLGTVIHSNTVIEDDVEVYQNVTIGRADVINDGEVSFLIKKGSILCAGAKVLCRPDSNIVIGENAVVAANAVLLCSVPPGEVWGGVPAKKIGEIKRRR